MDFQVMLNKLLHQRPNVEKCSYLYIYSNRKSKRWKRIQSRSVLMKKVLDQNMFRIYVFSVHFLYNNKIINKNILSKYVSDHSDSCEYNHTISRCLSLIQ